MTKPLTIGARLLSAALLAVGAALSVVGAAAAGSPGDFVLPGSQAAIGGGGCVEDTEFMRRNHFEVIRHQRDETVYGGIRSTKHSLSGCVSCHVVHDQAGAPVPINGQGQFCAACHAYTAVKMNCFDCHATVPEGEAWNQAGNRAASQAPGGVGQGAPAAAAPAATPVAVAAVTALAGVAAPGAFQPGAHWPAGHPASYRPGPALPGYPAPFAAAPAAAGTASASGTAQ